MSVTGPREELNWDLMNWMPQMKAELLPNCMLRGPLDRSHPDTPSHGSSIPLMLYTGTKAYNEKIFISMQVEIGNNKIRRDIKGTVPRDFRLLVFFMDQFPPQPLSIPLGRYSQLEVHHRCHWHLWQMEKSSIRKILIILFYHLWIVELTNI